MSTLRGHILVVDDDQVFLCACANLLEAAGFQVLSATDFPLALERLEGTKPIDLLITDVVMPRRVNGFALARMAKMRRPGIKIIYLTGYDVPGVEKEGLGLVLRKPVDDDRLIAAVNQVLTGASWIS